MEDNVVSMEKEEKVGELTEEELKRFKELKQEEDELTFNIGHRQREMMALAMAAGEIRQRSVELMKAVRERIGIEDGKTVKIGFDGSVKLSK